MVEFESVRFILIQFDSEFRQLKTLERHRSTCAPGTRTPPADLIPASIYDECSIGPSIRPFFTSCCFTMTNMIQVCSNFLWARVLITNARPDEIAPQEGVDGRRFRKELRRLRQREKMFRFNLLFMDRWARVALAGFREILVLWYNPVKHVLCFRRSGTVSLGFRVQGSDSGFKVQG